MTVPEFATDLRAPWASLEAQMVKRLPAMQETWVRSLGWEDPLENEMATHSSTLAWKSPWTEEPGRLYSSWNRRIKTRLSNLTYHLSGPPALGNRVVNPLFLGFHPNRGSILS